MKREIIAILRGIKPNEVLAVAHSIADQESLKSKSL